jgi:hypothetical protein
VTRALRIALLGAVVCLAACGDDDRAPTSLNLSQPSAVAAFRGVTIHPRAGGAVYPYLAIANAASNELTVVDAVDDSIVLAPVPLRALVIPVPGRPALLASASLGDGKADLLVAVSAGDSHLQVVHTWTSASSVAFEVDMEGDVLALVPLPSAVGTARIAAALAGRRIAVAEFRRTPGDDGIGIEWVAVRGPITFDFQPIALAALPVDPAETKLYAASLEENGVAEIEVPPAAAPFLSRILDAKAPTRLVAAARLQESVGSPTLDATAFTAPPVDRVYAVLDESGCGPAAPIACGLVALDPVTGLLTTDPLGELPHRAPIPIPGHAHALAAAPPPEFPPDPAYSTTVMRIFPAAGPRHSTAVGAVASTNGAVYFVDLGRWELPSDQRVSSSVTASVSAAQARAAAPTGGTALVDQWLVLERADGSIAGHVDPQGLSTSVTLTPGYTPSARWTATYQGELPGLHSRRAQAGPAGGGAPWLALQVPGSAAGTFTEVVRLYDPTLGVQLDDVVVIEPAGLGTCTTFEARVEAILAPAASTYPGGAVVLAPDPDHPEWNACVDALAVADGATALRASFRAGEYVLVKGTEPAAVHVGRPALDVPFDVLWQDEGVLASACTLPPAVPWPSAPAGCDPGSTCREGCEALVRARLGRRIGYVTDDCGGDAACLARWPGQPPATGPALGFTLRLETAEPPPRDLSLVIDTNEGRVPFRAVPPAGVALEPRSVAVFDRSPYTQSAGLSGDGVRFLVPYAGGVVLDTTPTVSGAGSVAIR